MTQAFFFDFAEPLLEDEVESDVFFAVMLVLTIHVEETALSPVAPRIGLSAP